LDEQLESKETALSAIKVLNESLLKEVMKNEELIDTIKSANPEAESY
jgi:hypothetical protein